MTYASIDELTRAIGEDELLTLADPQRSGKADLALVQTALDDASAQIDGYLTMRYQLPLTGKPVLLRRQAIDIAVYLLAQSHAQLTEAIETRYKHAVRFLERVADGKAGLGLAEPEATNPGDADGSDNVLFDAPPERMMTRQNLSGM
ncbi:gp436 family protein [Polycladidibacter hongkongensis]|uniref:gp436 family protein n=1 Tax=Polycladidibacter hongkongensis TaxID=1647556 RepID=UPI00082C7AB0|nr:DUF1320 domain-containing protein [Pseudovibrio hongkongensis]